MAAKLKKGDKVVVLTGKDKGKQGEISSVSPKDEQGCRRRDLNICDPPHQAVAGQPGRSFAQGHADRPVEPCHR
jgi:hypothetical protein